MAFQEEWHGNVCLISFSGSLVGPRETIRLRDKFLSAVVAGAKHILLDCSKTDKFGSSAIRSIWEAAFILHARGGFIGLCGLAPSLEALFESESSGDGLRLFEGNAQALRLIPSANTNL